MFSDHQATSRSSNNSRGIPKKATPIPNTLTLMGSFLKHTSHLELPFSSPADESQVNVDKQWVEHRAMPAASLTHPRPGDPPADLPAVGARIAVAID